MAPKKRKAKSEDEDGLSDDLDAAEPAPKAKRPAKPKAPAEPSTDASGWTTRPPGVIYKDFGTKPRSKIAAFDLDGTLVNVKSGAQFPRDANDWKLFNKGVPEVVAGHHAKGYKVVIFTNQGGIKSALTGKAAANAKGRIDQVVAKLGMPALVIMATLDDEFRKPGRGMWDLLCNELNGGVRPDPKASFFVGDAAGRPEDFSDSDRKFAEGLGLEFREPEDEFGDMDGKRVLPQGATAAALDAADSSANAALVSVFSRLADINFAGDNKFKGAAFKKVAGVLAAYPIKVSLSNLKEVGKLPGVGKGSLSVIKEYLETGKVDGLDEPGQEAAAGGGGGGGGGGGAGGGGVPKAPSAAKAMAMNFM